MKQFYETYAEDAEKLSPLVRQISWTNNCIILSRAIRPTRPAQQGVQDSKDWQCGDSGRGLGV